MTKTMLRSLSIFFVLFITTLNAEESYRMSQSPATTVIITTTQGEIEVELLDDVAPKAKENFVTLSKRGYYDGLIFHRVIKDFMIQGGDPTGTGTGGESIWGRPFQDEFYEHVTFDQPGYLAMANAGPHTNGSQFFITTVPTQWLNGRHTIFGKVTKGMDVVKRIESVEVGLASRPLKEQKILSIKVKEADPAAPR